MMDAYTLHLLGMAVEAVEKRYTPNPDLFIYRGITNPDDPVIVWEVSNPFFQHEAATLADAMIALLRDLGVEVPERPSAEEINDLYGMLRYAHIHGTESQLNVLRSASRPVVIALLEDKR